MISATVRIPRSCRLAKRFRSGMRAISPSGRITSQITAAGSSPASLQRSTEASVWPARTSTPPVRARSGKMWPGRTRSAGCEEGSASTSMVRARSRAEIPVVIPRAASTLMVKAVPSELVLRRVIIGSRSRSTDSSASGTQISPRAWVAMKFTRSGVQNCAGTATSPSFSRSSSSTMMIGRPARNSSTASGTPMRSGDRFALARPPAGGSAMPAPRPRTATRVSAPRAARGRAARRSARRCRSRG